MQPQTLETNPSPAQAGRSDQSLVGEINFRKFLSSSSAAFAVRAAAAGFAFVMNVVVARVLGAHDAGLFFLGQTFLLILAMISRFGMDNVLVRFVSTSIARGDSGGANGVLWKAISVTGPLAILVAALTFTHSEWIAVSLLNQPEFAGVLRSVAICVIPFSCFQLLSFALQGSKQFVWSILINATLLPCSLLIVASWPHLTGVDSADSLMRIAVFLSLVIAMLSIMIWIRTAGLSVNRATVGWAELISAAFPIFCVAIISHANTWAPHLVLAAYFDSEQVAILAVSQKTAALLALFLLPVSSVAAPTFAAMFAGNEHVALRGFVRRVNGVILLASVPLLLLIFVFAPQVLSIFGAQFTEAKWVLRVMIVGQFFTAISGSMSYLLMMTGHERLFRNACLVSTVAGLALAFLCIPVMGALGAAIAVSGSLVIANAVIWVIAYHRLGVNVFRPDIRFAVEYLIRRPNG